jgi:phosphoserine phosphatase RsbU/P
MSNLFKKILIADDDPVTRLYLKNTLEKWGYEVIAAKNGISAWAQLRVTNDIKVTILDWQMPGFSGLELIQKMREERKDYYIYNIILTSRDTHQDMLESMTAGADDYIRKPFDPQELYVRLRAAERILKQQEALLEMRNQEINLAARIQKSLLFGKVHQPRAWFSTDLYIAPAKKVGGDFYNFYQPQPHILDILLGDVMGKGLAASIVAAGAMHVVNSYLANSNCEAMPSPEMIVNHLNKEMAPQLLSFGNFIALTYARFDYQNKKITFVDCGNMPILKNSRENQTIIEMKSDQMPLGFSVHEQFLQTELDIHCDERYYFFSDGLTELQDDSKLELGTDRLYQLLSEHATLDGKRLINILKETLIQFTMLPYYEDDISFISIKLNTTEQ